MSDAHPVLRSFSRRLWCWLVGHNYYVHQKFSSYSRRVRCDHCSGDWGMNDDVRAFIPWSTELEEVYRIQGYRILKP